MLLTGHRTISAVSIKEENMKFINSSHSTNFLEITLQENHIDHLWITAMVVVLQGHQGLVSCSSSQLEETQMPQN